MMKLRHKITLAATLLICGTMQAEEPVWTVDSCMAYAVEHNRTVRQKELQTDIDQLDKLEAAGNFLPGVSARTSAAYNFGRSVDPETNLYNNVSTFQNGYALEASLPIFQGGSLVQEVKRAKAAILLGKAELQEARDNAALNTFQAYIDALYFYGAAELARKKLAESDSLVYKTRLQEELGLKGRADVLQVEAQRATDAYQLTKQENDYATALLTLKQTMNLPSDRELRLDNSMVSIPAIDYEPLDATTDESTILTALSVNPTLRQAEMNRRITLIEQKKAWAGILPSISLAGSLSTSYFKELHKSGYPSFGTQFDANLGRYVGVSVSIPIFSRFSGTAGIRRARLNHRIACEKYEEQRESLQKLVQQAVNDRRGFLKESMQMEKKVEADSLAYEVTLRKFEEGLMTSLDLQNSASQLQESRMLLLQSRLTYLLKCRLVDYYQGKDIIRK